MDSLPFTPKNSLNFFLIERDNKLYSLLLIGHLKLKKKLGYAPTLFLELNFRELKRYGKIPKIAGAYIFQGPFLRGIFLEGLIFGGAYLQREICVSKSIRLTL